ncbi:hypothetical protein LZQ00_00910 [Sphingobacterium sp. SRCM116780]|uniref:hypothetical protein n=1 Tax=Sphingobacterium sp. SRCM116780 TaxID=2907623 RepID=UPI001F318478|nr:hypothetical protein [Sphingobacterium sp. SRCM116780]UIR56397.1 hypothetical protein LZQ00_00910 [Sphingobacterium sp. SRCM116780]
MDRTNFNTNHPQESNHPQDSKGKNKKKTIIWIVVLVALIAIAVVVAYSYGGYIQRQKDYNYGDDQAYSADSVLVNGWASQEDYANWKGATFTIPEYNDIPVSFQRAIVKIFMDNNFYTNENDNQYFFTKIKDRAARVLAYGNFTGQGDRELAFLLEKQDFSSSAIFIITETGNLLYWKELSNELPTIKRFAKGNLIYMDEMKLVPAPTDGIIKQNKSSKHVLIYNRQTKTFDEYYQYTNDDIKNSQAEEEGEEEIPQVIDTTEVEHQE